MRLTDDRLWDFPFLHITGHGNIRLNETEVVRLREYLLRGGFLHVSDNYGLDTAFRREIARVFPDRPLVDVPVSHPIYHLVYDFPKGLPKIHEHDGKPPQGFGLFHKGRLVLYYTYESNPSDAWNDPEVHGDPPQKREEALKFGTNILVWALTH